MRLKRVKEGKWTILAACKARGDCPLLNDLIKLQGDLVKDRNKLMALLNTVAEAGPPKNPKKCRPIKSHEGLFEFREGKIRVLWFYGRRHEIVCSHMFLKKTQATPPAEIARAAAVLRSYSSARKLARLTITY